MSVVRHRKPSVADSRRFCADSFALPAGGSAARQQQGRGKHASEKPTTNPQIFLNGRNVTPQPLCKADDDEEPSGWSIEEIGYLRPDAPGDGTSVSGGSRRPLAWPDEPDADDVSSGGADVDDVLQIQRCATARIQNKMKNKARVTKESECKDRCVHQNQRILVSLTESRTEFLLCKPGYVVTEDDPEYEEAKRRNAAFENAKSKKVESTGRFKERAAQTFHNSQRDAASMASSPESRDCGVGFSPHDLKESELNSDRHDNKFVESFTAALITPSGCLLDVSDGHSPMSPTEKGNCPPTAAAETIQHVLDEWSKSMILGSPELAAAARTMELAVQQTFNGKKQLQFLGIPNGIHFSRPLQTDKLFSFCSASHDRPVTTMCWHKTIPHNLAVGYGRSANSTEDKNGMIMLWSLRNFDHPEMLITTASEVNALDYSMSRPSLIAAGLLDGSVLLYDTSRSRESIEIPVAESSFIHGRHQQPVNAVKWMTNQGRYEKLISCSSDGRVMQWSYHKGLSLTPLMTLNRSGGTGSAISRVAAGLCFSFSHQKATEYLVGTSDGDVIKCSTSYSEQILGTIQEAHTAPILQIMHSPFVKEAFLTCSADWSTKLWTTASFDGKACHSSLSSVNLRSAVNDIAWSPTVSTVFALVANDGRIEIYDLYHSLLDPKETIKPSAAEGSINMKRTTCCFTSDGSSLITGSSGGKIDVFTLPTHLTSALDDDKKEANRLKNILFSNNNSAIKAGN